LCETCHNKYEMLSTQTSPSAHFSTDLKVDIPSLDKDNRGWVEKYIKQAEERLAEETPQTPIYNYYQAEIERYQHLLNTHEKS
jgi:hypothetical protein